MKKKSREGKKKKRKSTDFILSGDPSPSDVPPSSVIDIYARINIV